MGLNRRIYVLLVLLWSALIATPTLVTSQPPADLPTPPPLPEDMLSKRPSEPPPNLPDPSELIAQLKQLEELLSLQPDKLQKLRETIEFIEKMSGEEREAMRIRLSQVTQMTGALRTEINTLADLAPEISKSDLSQFWLAASEAERADIRSQMEELESGQKQVLLSNQVKAFVQHRDAVFARMKETLEAKRQAFETPGN